MGDREIPKQNRLLTERWESYTLSLHQLQVRNAKPVIQVNSPVEYGHLLTRAKKRQQGNDRAQIIERDNLKLLVRSIYHLLTTHHHSPPPLTD